MARRGVSVGLSLENGQFKTEIDITTVKTEGLDRTVEKLDRDITRIPPDAAKAAASLKLLGGEAEGVGKKLNDVGPGAVTSLDLVDRKLVETRAEVKRFADEFNKTGSGSSLTGLLGAQDAEKDLEKFKKELTSALGDGGKDGAKLFLGSVSETLKGLPPEVQAALVAGVAVAAPVLGAAVGGALLAGVGAAGIGIGIAGQIHDPAVASAVGQLRAQLGAGLTESTSAFAPALVKAAGTVGDAFHQLEPGLKATFDGLAPSVDHLVKGITGLATNAAPGFEKAMLAGGKVLDQISKSDLPKLGAALGNGLGLIADNSAGAADGLHQVLSAANALILATSGLVNQLEQADIVLQKLTAGHLTDIVVGPGLSKALDGNADSAKNFNDILGKVGFGFLSYAGKGDKAKGSTDYLHGSTDTLSVSMQVAAASIDLAAGKAMSASEQYGQLIARLGAVNQTADIVAGTMSDKVFSALLGSDQAALGWNESLTKLDSALKENKRSLDIHSAAGQADREAILGAVQANVAQYDSNIRSGMSATDAASAYDANTAALERQLRKAGLTQGAIDGLIGKYRNVPGKVDTDIAVNGLTDAITDLDTLIRQINGLHSKTITIQGHVYTNVDPSKLGHGLAMGGLRRAAVGMVIPPSNPGTVLTGEPQTGGEILTPLRGISQSRAMRLSQMVGDSYGFKVVPQGPVVAPAAYQAVAAPRWAGAQTAGGAGAGNQTTITFTVNAGMGTDGAAVGRQIAQELGKYVERAGGNVQQVIMRRQVH